MRMDGKIEVVIRPCGSPELGRFVFKAHYEYSI